MRGIKGLVWEGSLLDAEEVRASLLEFYAFGRNAEALSASSAGHVNYYRVSVSAATASLSSRRLFRPLRAAKSPFPRVSSGFS